MQFRINIAKGGWGGLRQGAVIRVSIMRQLGVLCSRREPVLASFYPPTRR